jgi:hypothetical protein
MTALLARVHQAALNPPPLARNAIQYPRLTPDIIEGLKADTARTKYGCAKALRIMSEKAERFLMSHLGDLATSR